MVDKLKFILAALAVVAGIAGFYLLAADAGLLRLVSVLGGIAVAVALVWTTVYPLLVAYQMREALQELELTLARSASPADAALSSAQQVDAEGVAVDGRADTTSLAAAVTEAFDYLNSAQRSSTEVASSLGELVADVESRLSDPAGMVSTAFEYRSALSRTRAALLDRRAQYLGSDAALTVTIAEDMSLARAAVVAYGDASKASQLAGRNRIDDPTLIPAGTVLVL